MRRINSARNSVNLKQYLQSRTKHSQNKNNSAPKFSQTTRKLTITQQQLTNIFEKTSAKNKLKHRRRISPSKKLFPETNQKYALHPPFSHYIRTTNQTQNNHQSSARLKRLTYVQRHQNITSRMQTKVIRVSPCLQDIQDLQSIKNKILQSIFNKQPSLSSNAVSITQDKQNISPGIAKLYEQSINQLHPQNVGRIEDIQGYIAQWIDPVSPLLNQISEFMISRKIPFRFTMFLMYKLFWLRRQTQANNIRKIIQSSPSDNFAYIQLKKQNKQIKKCASIMLEKLTKSKKWKQTRCKHVFQDFSVSNQNLINLTKILTFYAVKDFKQLTNIDSASDQQMVLSFGCCYIVQIYDSIPSHLHKLVKQFKHLNLQNILPIDRKQLCQILQTIDIQFSIKF